MIKDLESKQEKSQEKINKIQQEFQAYQQAQAQKVAASWAG